MKGTNKIYQIAATMKNNVHAMRENQKFLTNTFLLERSQIFFIKPRRVSDKKYKHFYQEETENE